MLKTELSFDNGKPMISVNGELHYPLAYTTYFDECGEWSDFADSGYKMFFVNISFTDLPINNFTGFTPFRTGVFESDTPDYSEFDGIVRGILSECPEALLFPRINIAMPRKWIENNPYETVKTPKGGARESLYSDLFRRDGAELLKEVVSHIRNSDYADRIAGYHLCGGITQEWMNHDLYGSFSEMGVEKFREWSTRKYGAESFRLPEKNDFESGVASETYCRYCEFCNQMTSETVEHFARTVKEFINNEQIVGVFYGYNAFVNDPLYGLHGLNNIIDSPYIDFFSSPCCYDGNRSLGMDWGDMIPVDSVRLHGKLSFIECDIRTYLTRGMQKSRPGRYPDDIYLTVDADGNKTVWSGPDTLSLSLSAIRKAFAHQLSKSSGIWWFDMWGGWYHDEKIMAEIGMMKDISESLIKKDTSGFPSAETVLFIDEKAYANIARGNPLMSSVNNIRVAMGNTGIPFDIYMVEDAEKVIRNYRAAVFTAPFPSEAGKNAIGICETHNIPYISSTPQKSSFSTAELRDILVSFGVHCYNDDSCVVYCSNGYLGIHTVSDGEVRIKLPEKFSLRALFGSESDFFETDFISFEAEKHSTVIFELN